MNKPNFQSYIKIAIVSFTIFCGSQVSAASVCKGQSDTVCDQNSSCYWVAGYKRSDGASVKGHCRAKPQSSLKDKADTSIKNDSASSNKNVAKTSDKTKMSATSTPASQSKNTIKNDVKKENKSVKETLKKTNKTEAQTKIQ